MPAMSVGAYAARGTRSIVQPDHPRTGWRVGRIVGDEQHCRPALGDVLTSTAAAIRFAP
jgi:hypothetical protein